MRNSAAGITDTTYHLYAVRTAASSAGDIYAHTSATVATVITALQAESGGTDYVYARRIGSIIRSGATILSFVQYGDEYWLKAPVRNVNNSADHSTAATATLTVPVGLVVKAFVNIITNTQGDHGALLSALTVTDTAPSLTDAPGIHTSSADSTHPTPAHAEIWTDTSAGIRYRASNAAIDTVIITRGWRDPRGRDA
jgi:hypothetical protein